MNKKETAETFMKQISTGNIQDAFDKYVHTDFKHHNAYTPYGRDSLMNGMIENESQFPDKTYEIMHSIQDDNMVVVHGKLTLKADMPVLSAVHIMRFEDDKIIELWDVVQQIPEKVINSDGIF